MGLDRPIRLSDFRIRLSLDRRHSTLVAHLFNPPWEDQSFPQACDLTLGIRPNTWHVSIVLNQTVFYILNNSASHLSQIPGIGGGDETFDRIMTAVREEFDFGAWDARFRRCQMEKSCLTWNSTSMSLNKLKCPPKKPSLSVLNSKEHTQLRGGVECLGWLVLRRKQSSPTVQELLSRSGVFQWNIFASWVFMMRLMQTSNVCVTAGPSDPRGTCKCFELSCACVCTDLAEHKIKRVVRSSFTAEACSMSTWEHLDWMLTKWEQMTHSDFVLVHCDQWKCVNCRSLVADVWLHACRRATVSSVSLFVSLLCLSLHCTGVERKHICTCRLNETEQCGVHETTMAQRRFSSSEM